MNIETKIDQILKIVTMNQQDLTILKKDVVELKERVGKLEERVGKLEERVGKLEERVGKLEERVTSLERSVSLMEFEHGEKIRALFDYIQVNKDEHKSIENKIELFQNKIQGTLESHEKRISKLEGNLVPSF